MTIQEKGAEILVQAVDAWKAANAAVVAATQEFADRPSQDAAKALWDAWGVAESQRLAVYRNWGPFTLAHEEHQAPA
ncbi:hypothetical protein [Achromobacter insolitus]|uniref:hypothetical protein n=1 Tax=Achromobacter insolitus TaxID=217204 RepID=UPI002FE1F9A6